MKLVRDTSSHAVINVDNKEYHRISSERKLKNDVNLLKKEVKQLKKMINILLNEQ